MSKTKFEKDVFLKIDIEGKSTEQACKELHCNEARIGQARNKLYRKAVWQQLSKVRRVGS